MTRNPGAISRFPRSAPLWGPTGEDLGIFRPLWGDLKIAGSGFPPSGADWPQQHCFEFLCNVLGKTWLAYSHHDASIQM